MNDDLLDASLHELYEQAPCGYIFTLPDGMIVRVNQTFLTWTGYARDELVSARRFQDLLTVPGKIFYETQYAPLVRLQGFVKEVAFDLVRCGREPLPVLVSSIQQVDADGRPLLIASTMFESTDRRAYERELLLARRRAEQLAAVVTASSDAILTTSPEGVVQTWNAGAARLFGYTAEEIVGRSLHDILAPAGGDAGWQWISGYLRLVRAVHLEPAGLHADGRRIDVPVGLTPHLVPLGELAAVSAIIRDITDRVRVEAEVRRLNAELEERVHERTAQLEASHARLEALSAHLLAVQEAERAHLARELHDEIGQLLTGLSLALTVGPQVTVEALRERLTEAQRQVNALTAQVRTMSLDLRPAMLDDLGLLPALRWYVRRYTERTGVVVALKHRGLERRFQPEVEIAAYRIIQEALTNVARHAGVGEVTVRAWMTEDLLAIQVEDAGRGFDTAAALATYEWSGLAGLQERGRLLGGSVVIESAPGAGTRVLAELPLGEATPGRESTPWTD